MLTKLYVQMHMFMADRKGVTAIEYAIIAVAIAGIVATVFGGDTGLKAALQSAVNKVTGYINGA